MPCERRESNPNHPDKLLARYNTYFPTIHTMLHGSSHRETRVLAKQILVGETPILRTCVGCIYVPCGQLAEARKTPGKAAKPICGVKLGEKQIQEDNVQSCIDI